MDKKVIAKILLYMAIIDIFGQIGYYAVKGEYISGTLILSILAGILVVAGFLLGREPKQAQDDDDDF